jgi:hypothetical protein
MGEALEELVTEGLSLFCEVVDLPLLLTYHLDVLASQPFLLKALKEGVDKARADLLSNPALELPENAVSVSRAFVEDSEETSSSTSISFICLLMYRDLIY